ncbi:hypothetical protein GLAREA_02647 [Glarea lozoyensis ATCC 20868]|uniref:Transmembrane protein n=1 Tax=Glarea lozoyensis (strain ATCC 20868 / MF5171) TaxID=1116229 RepID=S3DJL4_GLAL2|nr:uncharacterized protein GLAREA_02647 [Glarea lozoyensis ATCC 20868]EPE26733.1 hypothetical protein GLAREA_02647 [Glarea lozoyensis ATCC 20868]
MDSDTYQQVVVPARAHLSDETLPYYTDPLPPPYTPSRASFVQWKTVPYDPDVKYKPRSERKDRRNAFICVAIAFTLLVVLPAAIFGIVVAQVNRSEGYVQRQACMGKHGGVAESVVDGEGRCG